MTDLDFSATSLTKLFREVGLYSPKNQFYAERTRKHQQILAYIEQIKAVLNKLSTKKAIVFLDCGCGKSYLSFILYEYCKTVLKRPIKIIGADINSELIDKCNNSAKTLGFENMEFYCSDVEKFTSDTKIDIVYSLHACNTATDQTIAKGIKLGAKYIFSVSCCQHLNRSNIKKHPLTSITRYQVYKERLVDMIGDSMRALLLEHFGYGVKLYEFISTEYTPKNIMLRAKLNNVKKQNKDKALNSYKELVEMFHFAPALEDMLSPLLQ